MPHRQRRLPQMLDRREFLHGLGCAGLALGFVSPDALAKTPLAPDQQPILKVIPSTGEKIPAIGMGTWITFNVGENQKRRDERADVAKMFFDMGGTVIDSSPMYSSSEAVVGYALRKLSATEKTFSATKVWTSDRKEADAQIANSFKLWGVNKFSLYQVHNLDGWQENLKLLFDMKVKNRIKYVGITTSHGRRHDDMAKIMRSHPIDFIQLTYNLDHLEAENLLQLAQERRIAVIINRPLNGGELFSRVKGKSVPDWCKEIGVQTWSQYFLKFVISHPAVTCAIPATSVVSHMSENMNANRGLLPDAKMREKMLNHWKAI